MQDVVKDESSVVRFQVLTVASMKIGALRDVAPCSLVSVGRRLRWCTTFNIRVMDDDGGCMHLRNVGLLQQDYTALHPRRL
jgi:hypothetical protein